MQGVQSVLHTQLNVGESISLVRDICTDSRHLQYKQRQLQWVGVIPLPDSVDAAYPPSIWTRLH